MQTKPPPTLFRRTALACAAALLATCLPAQVALDPLFSDDMVLQRGAAVPVWGSAAPGETVVVTCAGGQAMAVADAVGGWRLDLPALPVGGPYVLTAAGASQMVTLNGVLVGEVWLCSGQSNMNDPLRNSAAELAAAAIASAGKHRMRFYVSGLTPKWLVSSPTTAGDFSGVAFFFGRELEQRLQVPVGLVLAADNGSTVSSWRAGGSNWSARVAPLVPFGIRGVAWYQGESNALTAVTSRYASDFRDLVDEWRRAWGQGEFPFVYVQLPGYVRAPNPGWMQVREAQLEALASPNLGMAIMLDTITGYIHPSNKDLYGFRLALAARALAYGESVQYSGPLYAPDKSYVRGAEYVVGFDQVGAGLRPAAGGQLGGFQVAASNMSFVAANARLEGDTVVVSSPSVPSPAAVRYAWGITPTASLFNLDDLPASPFRTAARHESFGVGCGATPAPRLLSYLLPRTGSVLELRPSGLPAGSAGVLALGSSALSWNGAALPLDLTSFGYAGCSLYTSVDATVGFSVGVAGAGAVSLAVPQVPAFYGTQFHGQAFALCPSAPGGLCATDAGRGTIGPR